MRYLIIALLLWSCADKVEHIEEPEIFANPYIIIHDPEKYEIMDSSFNIRFKCYPFNAPRWEKHSIKYWRLITDESYEIIDTNLTEELEKVHLTFKRPGGHWIAITAMQDNHNIGHEIIHIVTI